MTNRVAPAKSRKASEDSGFQRCSTGDKVYVNYHTEEHMIRLLEGRAFSVIWQTHMASPSAASKPTTDLIVAAKK